MALNSREYIGIAEGIKKHELSTRRSVEHMKSRITELSCEKSSLYEIISRLDAIIEAEYERTDENGCHDYSRIASYRAEKASAERKLTVIEQDIQETKRELRYSENKLESIMEEKAKTLFEIQERARTTSKNIVLAGEIYGAYSGVGVSLQETLKKGFSSLTLAARVLDGRVDDIGYLGNNSRTNSKNISGINSGSNGSRSEVLCAFTSNETGSNIINYNKYVSSNSRISNYMRNNSIISDFNKECNINSACEISNFISNQKSNDLTAICFNNDENTFEVNKSDKYLSKQKSNNIEIRINNNKTFNILNILSDILKLDNNKILNTFGINKKAKKGKATSLYIDGFSLECNDLSGSRFFVKGNHYNDFCFFRENLDLYERSNRNEVKVINSRDIEGIYLNESEINDFHMFWNRGKEYEIDSEEFFMNVASYIPKVKMLLDERWSVEQIQKNEIFKTCYDLYFANPIRVYEIDGYYHFVDAGRHRCMAAQKLGYDIPINVVGKYEYKTSYPSYISFESKLRYANSNYHSLRWAGHEGNSLRIPKDNKSTLSKELEKKGVLGIEYKNGDPDFSTVSVYEFKIEDMHDLFENLSKMVKNVDSREKYNGAIRRIWQAYVKDKLLNDLKNDTNFVKEFQEKTGIDLKTISSRDRLSKVLRQHNLTLHETSDCSSIQFVPTIIHKAYKHIGGTAEMCERMISVGGRLRMELAK